MLLAARLVQLVDDEARDDDLRTGEALRELDDPPVDQRLLADEEAGLGPARAVGRDQVIRDGTRGGGAQVPQSNTMRAIPNVETSVPLSSTPVMIGRPARTARTSTARTRPSSRPIPRPGLSRIPMDARLEEHRQHEKANAHADNEVGEAGRLVDDRHRPRPQDHESQDHTQIVHGSPRVAGCAAADDIE